MTYFKRRKSVGRDIERRDFDISEEVVEIIRIDHNLSQCLISRAFSQHCTTIECNVLMLIAAKQSTFIVNIKFYRNAVKRKYTHPDISVKRISGLVHIYSTVGDLVPICLRRILLKTCATSFFPLISEIKL
jgi:hypothetical protein